MKLLTDEEYCDKMKEIRLVEDPEYGKFFQEIWLFQGIQTMMLMNQVI